MNMELLKVDDMVCCHYGYHIGIGYGKVIKIVDRKTKKEFQEYGPIITGWGDKNSELDITIQFVGYDMKNGDNEDDLGDIIEVDDIRVLDPHSIYRVIDEEMIYRIRSEWERLLKSKLEFLYKHINKESLTGRKYISKLEF